MNFLECLKTHKSPKSLAASVEFMKAVWRGERREVDLVKAICIIRHNDISNWPIDSSFSQKIIFSFDFYLH